MKAYLQGLQNVSEKLKEGPAQCISGIFEDRDGKMIFAYFGTRWTDEPKNVFVFPISYPHQQLIQNQNIISLTDPEYMQQYIEGMVEIGKGEMNPEDNWHMMVECELRVIDYEFS